MSILQPTPDVRLSEQDINRGFKRPVRTGYQHTTCSAVMELTQVMAETFARNPGFYIRLRCAKCLAHLPSAEFVWMDGVISSEQVGT